MSKAPGIFVIVLAVACIGVGAWLAFDKYKKKDEHKSCSACRGYRGGLGTFVSGFLLLIMGGVLLYNSGKTISTDGEYSAIETR